jgi:hypothetical protein
LRAGPVFYFLWITFTPANAFVAAALMAAGYKREDLCMEHLIREFGAWLKQGFGWLVDVIVFGCLWGISEVSRLFGTHFGGAPILKIVVLVLVLLLLLYAFYWVFGRFIGNGHSIESRML